MSTYRFVKASERLPEKKGNYITRSDSIEAYQDRFFHNDGMGFISAPKDLEWREELSESPALPGKVEEIVKGWRDRLFEEAGIYGYDYTEKLDWIQKNIIDPLLAGFQSAGGGDAIGFVNWIFKSDYRLNPHCEETRWRHVSQLNIKNKFIPEGITTAQLYALYPGKKVTSDGVLREALEKLVDELGSDDPKYLSSYKIQLLKEARHAIASHPRPGAQEQDGLWKAVEEAVKLYPFDFAQRLSKQITLIKK